MNKIILAISIFCVIPVEAMLTFGPVQYTYRKGGDRRVTLAHISQDIFLYNMFPSSLELNEIATLLKKFPNAPKKTQLIDMLENIVSLIHISQTSKGFNEYLKDEINKKVSLPYVSLNSVSICISNYSQYKELLLHCNGNISHCRFDPKSEPADDSFRLRISLLKEANRKDSMTQLYSEKQYNNLYALCATLLDYVKDDQKEAGVLCAVQEQCRFNANIRSAFLDAMDLIILKLRPNLNENIIKSWLELYEFGKIIAPSYYKVHFVFNNGFIPQTIKDAFFSGNSNDLKNIIQVFLPSLNISQKEIDLFVSHFHFLSKNNTQVVLNSTKSPNELCFLIKLSGDSNERNVPVDMLNYKENIMG